MASAYTFEYELTHDMVADGAVAFLDSMRVAKPTRKLHVATLSLGLLFVQVAILLVWVIIEDMDTWLIVATALVALFLAVCTMLYALVVYSYPISRRRIEATIWRALEELKTSQIRWTLSLERFHVDPAQRDHAWSEVVDAFVGRKFWILQLDNGLRIMLPVAAMPDGAERFMLDRLTSAGTAMRVQKATDDGDGSSGSVDR